MTTVTVKLHCPQGKPDEYCVGKDKCKKDKRKGCAIETLEIWKIKQEEYDEFVPWSARM